MTRKQTPYTKFFGWLAIGSLIGCFLCIPLVNVLGPQIAGAMLNVIGFFVLPSFIAWLIARNKSYKQEYAIARANALATAPPPAQSPNDSSILQTEIIEIETSIAPMIEEEPEQSMEGIYVGSNGSKYYLNNVARSQHVYISGKTQQGKSTLIHGMALQDIVNGDGVCVIDAKGDLIPKLIQRIPIERRDDCIILDLKTPIPLDFMSCENTDERPVLVSDIIQIFKRLDEGWGVRMEALLRYVLHTLLVHGNCSFLDIYRILADRQFREKIVNSSKVQAVDPLRLFWADQFDKLGKDASTPIIVSRMADFLLSPSLSTILDAKDAKLNISDCMENSKILLVNLAGATDEAMVYGSLLVSKIQQAAFRRSSIPKEHVPFYLYVDEFQNFRPSGFDKILSMAGGLRLCLTLANQYFNQLDSGLQDAIINNVSTYFLFRMGVDNAARLKGEIHTPVPYVDLQKIRKVIEDNKELIRFWQDQLTSDVMDGEKYHFINSIIREGKDTLRQNEAFMEEAKKPQPTFLDMLPTLPRGTCIYRAADGHAYKINTPPPEYPVSPNHAQYIHEHTLAQYGLKRTVNNAPCNIPPVPHNEGNDDEPQPGGSPSVPPHES